MGSVKNVSVRELANRIIKDGVLKDVYIERVTEQDAVIRGVIQGSAGEHGVIVFLENSGERVGVTVRSTASEEVSYMVDVFAQVNSVEEAKALLGLATELYDFIARKSTLKSV